METYISLLRGVNMAGHNRMRMRELTAAYESIGFGEVTTYIQSGNVVFKARKERAEQLEKMAQSAIEKAFGLRVAVFVRTAAQWQQTVSACPFEETEGAKNIYVTFLAEPPSSFPQEEINRVKEPDEQVLLSGRELFFYLPSGYAKTRLSNGFFETKLQTSATTRNWRTVNKLSALLSKAST